MTPLQRSEDFYERWQTAVMTGRRIDFDIVKEIKRVVEAAIKQDRKTQDKRRKRVVPKDKEANSTPNSSAGSQKKQGKQKTAGKKPNRRRTKGTT